MAEPWFAATLDGLTPASNPAVSNSNLPVTVQRGISFSAAAVSAISPVLPERTSGSAGCAIDRANATGSRVLFQLLGSSGSNRIRIIHPSSSVDESFVEYWDGSSWVAIGAGFPLSTDANQVRIEWSGYGTSSGAISARIFKDAGESLVASRSASGLNFTSLSGITQLSVGLVANGSQIDYSAMFVADDNGDTSYVYQSVANANGADTGGTGSFSSINTTGTGYDSTFISLNTAGLRRSVKNSAARNYDSRSVRAVAINARLRRGATGPTRATLYLTIGGTRYYHPNVQLLTTSFESYTFVFENDPSTSAPWTTSAAEAASLEWGVEAVA